MKIILDLQGAQCQSRLRGIGRYTRSLTRAWLAQAETHRDTALLLNARFDDACDSIIGEFHTCSRYVFGAPDGIGAWRGAQRWVRRAAARAQRHYLESLRGQVIWHSSLFEGYVDDVLLPDRPPDGSLSVATLYDLIPLSDPGVHLQHPQLRAWYEDRLLLLKKMHGLLAISDWVRKDAIERLGLAANSVVAIGAGVGERFRPLQRDDEAEWALRVRLGFDSPYVLYGGGFDERKNVELLVRAFAGLPRALRDKHHLLLVGEIAAEERGRLERAAKHVGLDPARLVFAGYVDDDVLVQLYQRCALFVFPSFREGFGLPPLEAMASGAPVIASNATSLPEVMGRGDILFDPLREASVVERMREVLESPERASELRRYGLARAADFSWERVATRARAALQELQARQQSHCVVGAAGTGELQVLDEIGALQGPAADSDIAAVAQLVVAARGPERFSQWLVDVSEIASEDIGTGVQRVVRELLKAWLASPPEGVSIEPVRIRQGRFHYARRYARFLLCQSDETLDEPAVEVRKGDRFIGLDWAVDRLVEAQPQLEHWRRHGVTTHFLVYDLLPLDLPECFHPYARARFGTWWKLVKRLADQLLCDSRATADAVCRWTSDCEEGYQFRTRPVVAHFRLGVDDKPTGNKGVLRDALVMPLADRPTLLMVGTLEPRKGYLQALDACEELWDRGENFNLVIVGHRGWMMEPLHERLAGHRERDHRLFWVPDADDAELEAIYRSSSILLAASFGEGFGLPLIEAARHGLPVIARDIPVFREVAGEHACYFKDSGGTTLVAVLAKWLHEPASIARTNTRWKSWSESAVVAAKLIAAAAS